MEEESISAEWLDGFANEVLEEIKTLWFEMTKEYVLLSERFVDDKTVNFERIKRIHSLLTEDAPFIGGAIEQLLKEYEAETGIEVSL